MRTNELKRIAERDKEDYEEYVNDCLSMNAPPMNIYEWIAMEIATADEYRNDMIRDDMIKDA